jgi:hypothetical protein
MIAIQLDDVVELENICFSGGMPPPAGPFLIGLCTMQLVIFNQQKFEIFNSHLTRI